MKAPLWIAALLALAAAPAAAPVAAEEDVDLELVFLADASGSIDDGEIMFQRGGYAEALNDPLILSAIRNGAYGRIAVAYVEWGDLNHQDVVVGWTVIDGPDSAAAFGDALTAAPRRAFGRNSISAALLKGAELINDGTHEGFRRVIDFSGDSANNWNGPPLEETRQAVLAEGIVINGLAILCRYCETGRAGFGDLEAEYAERIIGGPGAFVVSAVDRPSFADAVRRKILLEVAGLAPDRARLAALPRPPDAGSAPR